jgi:DNA topoisomerase-1
LSLKVGKFGAFIGCSNYPECKYTRQLAQGEAAEDAIPAEGKPLGPDPATGDPISLRTGRFGPYVQLGDGEKPKRASIPKGWKPEELDLERAIKLVNLPREVGPHPEDQQMILAGIGRYGPYIQKGSTYANLPGVDDVFEIGLNRAVSILEEKKNNPRAGRNGGATRAALKELGEHPENKRPVRVLEGRYGPYVSDGKVHANIPKGSDPKDMELDQAVSLLAARAEKGGGKAKKGKAAKPEAKAKSEAKAKPAPKKRAAEKKPAAAKAK